MRRVVQLILIILAIGMCYPMIFLLSGAVMSPGEIKAQLAPVIYGTQGFARFRFIPQYPDVRALLELLLDSPEFFMMFWNSVKLTACILAGQLLIGVPAAWGYAKFRFPLKNTLFLIYIILMMMPFQVTMLSGYLILDKVKLIDTHAAIILPAVFSTFPVFIMHRFFASVPDAVLESARIDGAGEWQIFIHFALPLGSGGIVSAMVLGFLEYWNLLEQPLAFLKTRQLWPLSLYLPHINPENAGAAFAASLIMLTPSVLVFIGGRDYLEQGIVAAAVKE